MARPTDTTDAGADASAAGRAALAERLAGQAGQVLEDLPGHLHPVWIGRVGADPATLAAGGPGLLNIALLARFDLRWPDLSAASHAIEIAWLLAPEQLRRLCAARALYAWRGALARSVDAGARRRARAMVGTGTLDAIISAAQDRREAATATLAIEPDSVVLSGWALLKQALPWRDARSRRLIDLMLPPAAEPATAALGEGQEGGPGGPAEHAGFLAALNQLFPEHAWLFGSEPATSTSA